MLISQNKTLKKRARILRRESTLSEVLLWKRLKNKQIREKKFRRQVPILYYIVDFYCSEIKLAIEIDGGSHYENQKYDEKRDMDLKNKGIKILRIGDSRVKRNIEGVIYEIEEVIDDITL